VRDIFSEVYATAQWGGKRGEFYSGRGSQPEVTGPYCDMIRQFIAEHDIRTVLDVGCGDFEVGQRIACLGVAYTGVDVVPALIERNRERYASATVKFECLDVTVDSLPRADLCLVRQVFQHLSNAQIAAALAQLDSFSHVIVTEHYPAELERCVPNLDKAPGPDTRLLEGSAVFLDRPPFERSARLLLTTRAPATLEPGETLRSFLVAPREQPQREGPL
jgi:SAM-dependent methyltransferase